MASQSELTITGNIGADPSGSHPTGNLNVNWAESIDDAGVKYTAETIMADQAETSDSSEDYTAYSEVLCVGPFNEGMMFDIGDTGNAQITACWQWYNPATGGEDADFVMTENSGTFGNGTWTDIGSAAQDYGVNYLTPDVTADALALAKGTMLRVKMVVTDGADDGVAQALIDAGVSAVNAAVCVVPNNKMALYNLPMVEAYSGQTTSGSIGGIGADPS